MFKKVMNLVKGKKPDGGVDNKQQFMAEPNHRRLTESVRAAEASPIESVQPKATQIADQAPMSIFKNRLDEAKVDEVALETAWQAEKYTRMMTLLGQEHQEKTAALIPFEIGGTLNLHYYPQDISGTAIATQELANVCKKSPVNDWFRKFELVMFTRLSLDVAAIGDKQSEFGQMHEHCRGILNAMARHSLQVKLNPYEVCELPEGMTGQKKTYLISAPYQYSEDGIADFGLMVLIEIFASERDYAQRRGGESLIRLLEEQAVYPYSDRAREPVI